MTSESWRYKDIAIYSMRKFDKGLLCSYTSLRGYPDARIQYMDEGKEFEIGK
jgi:hypothetical protein